jgi:hypothetical protein
MIGPYQVFFSEAFAVARFLAAGLLVDFFADGVARRTLTGLVWLADRLRSIRWWVDNQSVSSTMLSAS